MSRPVRRRAASLLLAVPLIATTLATPGSATPSPRAKVTPQIQHVSWSSDEEFLTGKRRKLVVGGGQVATKAPGSGKPRPMRIGGRTYDAATWTSPWVSPGFGATSIIPSWEATTTGNNLIRVEIRAQAADGTTGSWDRIADWSRNSRKLPRTTYSGQTDDLGRVSADTWVATSSVTAWQLRATLLRRGKKPVALERIGAVASADASVARPTSAPGPGAGVLLDVPTYSQMVHSGHYPAWGGGGEAWCSPTSTAMVLGYYGLLPAPTGITPGHVDAAVDHTAKMVYDHGYRGTGNWAFNTAYAATLVAGDSYVTRLRDLREAEDYLVAGVPLIVSIAFGRNQLAGAPISASNGHLLVIVGFEADGDVIVNDPAGASNASVRRVYDRAQFERIWLTASGGTTYVIRNS